MSLRPGTLLGLLSASMACWLERHAAAQIEYLKAENRALRVKLGHRRLLFTDAERRTLATLAMEVGRKTLNNLDPIVSPACGVRIPKCDEFLPAVVRNNRIHIFSLGPRHEYGMIRGCSDFCASLSEWSPT